MPAAQLQNTANIGAVGSVINGSIPHLAGSGARYSLAGGGRGAFVGMPRLRPFGPTAAANLHQAGRHCVVGVDGGAAAPSMPSASRQSAAIGASALGDRHRPLQR
ncbi:unnamed protein product, partial [Laminaria digitata]